MSSSSSSKGVKLLAHERALLDEGQLSNVTHQGASSVWLHAESSSSSEVPETHTRVYRPMGDEELGFLLQHGQLPPTQPYQAIIEGDNGRVYAEKYLNGKKWVDTHPTTVVEFVVPKQMVADLFKNQSKAEDGAVSTGLGHKAGGGLGVFNRALQESGRWRIVKVKRQAKTKGK
uniref:Uncharacterized protein n=1 Tax=Chromera velia CCMP2878 TaxID=1169474 RepID=A0A0G4GVS9_9ALVE|eukprot:Cvel_23601.t1-p1 / transcript=Cvel_23601.t1 / gene=Cvel_23601 / organism=Chromera_velia_CCMP2878 / gene_product=hypothetical protein / transcript_product=hypothetical protein / location=Cvel_scaffold2450:20679-21197(+) / protein_length=173 / sequence_SO=supercontig / SO=protein_coding / is_pseudo=false